MSSMVSHIILATMIMTPAAAYAASDKIVTNEAKPTNALRAVDLQDVQFQPGTGVPTNAVDISQGNIPAALSRWRDLSRGGNYSFSEYSSFLMTYDGWPNETQIKRFAEDAIDLERNSASEILRYFDRIAPISNVGKAKYAITLANNGRRGEAIIFGRDAWRAGALPDDIESRLGNIMGADLSANDHDQRIDALLWAGATRSARANLSRASAQRRPLFEAQLAVRENASDASAQITAAGDDGLRDAGLIGARANQLRVQGNSFTARQMLAKRQSLAYAPADIEEWYEILLTNARAAENDGQYQTAYEIASRVDDAIPAGEAPIEQSLGVRDDYTSLTWLAGQMALNKLNRPTDAAIMFEKYGLSARSPQTRTKGLYWAGKSMREAGNITAANAYFEQAAGYFDQFYGQLSIEALGRKLPTRTAPPPVSNAPESGDVPSVYLAAQIAPRYGGWKEQSIFLRAIANEAETEAEFLDAIALSKRLNRPDLQVMAARNARVEGYDNLIAYGFPEISIPSTDQDNFTLIHSITRQESQFDREAVSHANARGLMQLIPSTAQEVSGKLRLSYARSKLTSDPDYNIMLGSSYIQQMLRYYDGSYPLAVAAYNAGPGNVNKWLRRNGDPRTPQVDILDWIENIPVYETKNYVQRVLENAVMYDHLHPDKAHIRSDTPLSIYLNKTPG